MSPFHSPAALDANNSAEYARSAASGGYADAPGLKKAEEIIIRRIGDEVRDVPILDLGVGAGRTLPALTSLSSDYHALDYSPEMVAACRRRFPEARVDCGDARDLSCLAQRHFGFVCFAWNGIDYVNHEDRRRILDQVFRVLRPNGLFLFSSHNLNCRPRSPWNPSLHYWSGGPKSFIRYIYYSLRWSWHRLCRLHLQQHATGHAILVDELHDFRLLTYFVSPPEQVQQLKERGFEDIHVFDRDGNEVASDSLAINSAMVHYLCRRPRQ